MSKSYPFLSIDSMNLRNEALCAALILFSGRAYALSSGAGTGGAAFLDITQGSARAMALGQSFVALASGLDAITWNPAGLALTDEKEFSYSYLSYMQGIQAPVYMAYAQPVGQTVFAANASYMSDKSFDVRDLNGVPQSNLNVQVDNGYGTLAVARSFWYERIFVGGSLRLVHQDYNGDIQDSLVGDVGLLVKPNDWMTLGASYQNFGASQYVVGSTARAGLAIVPNDFFKFSFEVHKFSGDALRPGVGAEFTVPEEYLEIGQLAFRAGYFSADNYSAVTTPSSPAINLNAVSGISLGLGFYTSAAFGYGMGIDYAFVPMGALGTVSQFTLTTKF
jgi:hypothetical protein